MHNFQRRWDMKDCGHDDPVLARLRGSVTLVFLAGVVGLATRPLGGRLR